MAFEESTLARISQVQEFREVHEFLSDDPNVIEALDLVVKFVAREELPTPARAAVLVTKLQGLSADFAIKATVYATVKKDRAGTEYNMRKNVYYTLADQMDKLAAAMKIVAKL